MTLQAMRFEAREVKPYAEFVAPAELVEGAVYFIVTFLDTEMRIPSLEPLVFIGRNLEEDSNSPAFYFQDAASFFEGGSAYKDAPVASSDEPEYAPTVYAYKDSKPPVMHYDRALDVLLYCALARAAASSGPPDGELRGR